MYLAEARFLIIFLQRGYENLQTRVNRSGRDEVLISIFNYVLIALICLTVLFPILNIFALAFNSGSDAQRGGIYIWPRMWTLQNFGEVFEQSHMANGFLISIARTVLGTFLSLLLTSLAAYALTSKTLPGSRVIAFGIFFTMLFSGGIIPFYLVLKEVHLTNTFWVYIIPNLYNVWNIMVVRTFFQQVPDALEEAARLDGLNDFGILFRVILPLSKPVLATIALFTMVYHWNDWFSGSFFVRDASLRPASTLLQQMLTTQEALSNTLMRSAGQLNFDMIARVHITGDSLKMATIVLVVLPILLVFPFVQKHFSKGVTAGALKE